MKMQKVRIIDQFWKNYRTIVREKMIPYQWNVLNDAIDINIERERNDASIPNEKSHAIENFMVAAGRKKGTHYGWVFQDSDVYKWLEAVAYSLQESYDEKLRKTADQVVELISEAQEPDGYLDTYFTIKRPEYKFQHLCDSHELYCAGHFLEAAVAYHMATGNELVMEVARKLIDCIDAHFGEEEGKIHGCDGHEEIEIGLLRMYHLTGEEKYLKLSSYFLSIRGTNPDFFRMQEEVSQKDPQIIQGISRMPLSYFQMDKPAVMQETAEGHAVRVMYLCTALADLAATTKNEEVLTACKRLWNNIVAKRMYITGGIGSTVIGESFTLDYDLPNDTMYCETCASVGLIFFARQMLRNERKGSYADVMERALYNSALAGMSLDGTHFFYVNPLEAVPEKSKKDPTKSHVKCVRPDWLGCACCPPNLARLLASLDHYIYDVKDNTIYINLFISSSVTVNVDGGEVELSQETKYPWDGTIKLCIKSTAKSPVTIGIRIPEWAESYEIMQNGNKASGKYQDGYYYIVVDDAEEQIRITFPMTVKAWHANPMVEDDLDKVALSRGPIMYCLEEADNGNNLHMLSWKTSGKTAYEYKPEMLNGVGVITTEGYRTEMEPAQEDCLYTTDWKQKRTPEKLVWIPYYAWANRGENEMRVWVRESR